MDDRAAPRDPVYRMTRAWRELRRGRSAITLRDALFGVGPDAVDATHMDVLDLLAERDPWRMSDLADALRVDPSTVTRTLQRMEADGLAQRSHTPGDGRVVTVTMTEDGRQRHARVAALRADVIGQVMKELTADEQVQLVELNERFLGALDRTLALPDGVDRSTDPSTR